MKAEHAMHTLIKMIKDDEDRQFAKNCYYKASTIGSTEKSRRKTPELGFGAYFSDG